MVLWFTGHAARPYLRDGDILTQETVRDFQNMFGSNFMGYALWFN